MLKVFNFIFPVSDFVYLFQCEEYSFQRFNFWFWRFFFRRNIQKRDKLVFTARAKILIFFTVLLFILSNLIFFSIPFLVLSVILFPLYVVLANLVSLPVFGYLKSKTIQKAYELLQSKKRGNTKIISVMGSFGKTTTKNILVDILKTKYIVVVVPGNINTPLGIANWVVKNFDGNMDVFICEVDGYTKKEYEASAYILDPDISILTNVGDQHLQRFGSRENLARGIRSGFSKKSQAYLLKKDFEYLQSLGLDKDLRYVLAEEKTMDSSNRPAYLKDNVSLAISVAEALAVKKEYIDYALTNFKQPDRRGNIGDLLGFEMFDASYNISYTTAMTLLSEAKRIAESKNKKLLVVSAGIPELSEEDKDKNKLFAKKISEIADDYIFFKSIFFDDLKQGVGNVNNSVKDFKEFQKLLVGNYKKEEHLVLLFTELTDIYY